MVSNRIFAVEGAAYRNQRQRLMTVFASLLNNDFLLFRRQRTSDGQGGWPFESVQIGELRGRIRPASSTERVEARQEGREITHVFYQVADNPLVVARGDTLITDGLTVEVEGVREPSRADHHLEVDCREKQPEVTLEEGS